MNRCILFSRVSTLGQDLTQQTEEVKNEAYRNGYKDEDFVIIEYKESAIKLSEDERLGIQELKNAINSDNTIKCVFVYEISRLSRQTTMLYHIRDFLIEHQVQLICLKPYMRLLDNDGKMSQTASILFSLFASLSESEMMIKQERLKRGRRKAMEEGKFSGGKMLFGYKVNKEKRYVVDEEQAAIIRRIFNMYINNNMTHMQIGMQLRKEGFFPQLKLGAYNSTVTKILAREDYCGNDKYPQIISREQYLRAREIAEKNKWVSYPNTTPVLLKGKIYDKENGYLYGVNVAGGKYQITNVASNKAILMKAIDAPIYDRAVKKHKIIYSITKNDMIEGLQRAFQRNMRYKVTVVKDIEDLKSKIDKVEERLVLGRITESKADDLEKQIKIEILQCENNYKKYEAEEIRINKELEKVFNEQSVSIDYDNLDIVEKAKIVDAVIDRIILNRVRNKKKYIAEIIYRDGEIEVFEGTSYVRCKQN